MFGMPWARGRGSQAGPRGTAHLEELLGAGKPSSGGQQAARASFCRGSSIATWERPGTQTARVWVLYQAGLWTTASQSPTGFCFLWFHLLISFWLLGGLFSSWSEQGLLSSCFSWQWLLLLGSTGSTVLGPAQRRTDLRERCRRRVKKNKTQK